MAILISTSDVSSLPPILAATDALLADEPPVWVPLCTPNFAVCRYAFHPPGYRETEPNPEPRRNPAPLPVGEEQGDLAKLARAMWNAGISFRPDPNRPRDRGFRIVRWFRETGDLVLKNEPVAVVDASRARGNSVLRGLDLPDPVIYAPESGKLVWRHPSTEPHLLFGLIQSTNELIHANLRHPMRSDLVPMIDAIIARLGQRTVVWRRKLGLYDKAGTEYLKNVGTLGQEKGLRLMRSPQLASRCHGVGDCPSPEQLAPGWGKATVSEQRELLKVYAEPARGRYDRAWKSVVDELRKSRPDVAQMGFAFALSP